MPMSDDDLRAVVRQEIFNSVDYMDGEISEDRRRSMDLYYQEPFGNEQEGRSQFVSSDVQDVVESLVPDFMEIFGGSDEVCEFEPVGPEDEEHAKQATDYINFIWEHDNNGYQIKHDIIKTSLLQKNGILKVSWDSTPRHRMETLENINSLHFAELMADDTVEVVEHTEKQVDDMQMMQFAPDGVVHDAKIKYTTEMGRVLLEAVPPEDFLISRRSADIETARMCAHKMQKTQSDLLEMGFDEELVRRLASGGDDEDFDEERQSRFNDEEYIGESETSDMSSREIWLYDVYLKVDYDGDGISEYRQILLGGDDYTILENNPADFNPFVDFPCIKMPFKYFGRSMADLTVDIQKVKSVIQRQMLDNMYLINNARAGISNKVDLDDWLSNRPGQAVRVDTDGADVQGHFGQIGTVPIGQQAMGNIEYFDKLRETRTGVMRMDQGITSNAIHDTAAGVNQMMNQAAKRKLLIARNFADGFKIANKKILRLVINHQDRERTIRLRNQWVPIRPDSWNADMDVTIKVGLGYGTKESQMAANRFMIDLMKTIVEVQGGIQGPLLKGDNIFYILKRTAADLGYHNPDQLFSDPMAQENQPPQKDDPTDAIMQYQMMESQAKLALQEREFASKMQLEYEKFQADVMLKRMDAAVKRGATADEIQEERQQAANEMQLEREKFMADMALQREKMAADIALERQKIAGDLAVKQEAARLKGVNIQAEFTEINQ